MSIPVREFKDKFNRLCHIIINCADIPNGRTKLCAPRSPLQGYLYSFSKASVVSPKIELGASQPTIVASDDEVPLLENYQAEWDEAWIVVIGSASANLLDMWDQRIATDEIMVPGDILLTTRGKHVLTSSPNSCLIDLSSHIDFSDMKTRSEYYRTMMELP